MRALSVAFLIYEATSHSLITIGIVEFEELPEI